METGQEKISNVHKAQLVYSCDNLVGRGSFGNSYGGIYQGNIPVVIKKFKKANKDEVIHEAKVIKDLQKVEQHPSLPYLIGIYTKLRSYMLVTQFHGNAENQSSFTICSAVIEGLKTEKNG